MNKEEYKAKIRINKKTQQLMIHLSRKKLELLKKNPKFLKIKKEDLEF